MDFLSLIPLNYSIIILFSASIFIAAIIGWVRFKTMNPAFHSFVYCVGIASINEIISYLFTKAGINTAINNNIYVLLESMLLLQLFRSLDVFQNFRAAFYLIISTLVITWIVENFIWGSIWQIKSYFRILYSFCLVICSIYYSNRLFFSLTGKFISSAGFMICAGFIIYFTYKILIEAFWLWGSEATRDFRIKLYLLSTWINLFVNLIYAIAMLWIPRKPQHIIVS